MERNGLLARILRVLLLAGGTAANAAPLPDGTGTADAGAAPQVGAGAQPAACLAEREPNERLEEAMVIAGPTCVTGSISAFDQEIFAWTVSETDARRPWTITMEGPPGHQSRLQIHLLEELGDATTPAVVGSELLALVTPPGTSHTSRGDVFLTPGVWLVGLSVSAGEGGAYRLSLEASDPPPAPVTDNTAKSAAMPVSGAFAANMLLARPESWFSWTLSHADARRRWVLTASAPLDAVVGLELQTADGQAILSTTRLREGMLELADLGLPAGSYLIRLTNEGAETRPASLSARSDGPRSAGREDEPNDSAPSARPLKLGREMSGRIGREGDIDIFVLPPPDSLAGKLLDIEIGGAGGKLMRLCLGDVQGNPLQCREAVHPKLSDIALDGRQSFVTASGGADPESTYSLAVRIGGKVDAGAEFEPNDTIGQANTLPPGNNIRGHLAGDETDMFRLRVETATFWRLTVTGDAARSLEILDGSGQASARAEHTADTQGQSVADAKLDIKDVALPPGDYFVAVNGADGDYTLAATGAPLTAAAPSEREPNDSPEQAELLDPGEILNAALSSASDFDIYRISMPARGPVAIRIEPQSSCKLDFELGWNSSAGRFPSTAIAGQPLVYEALLDPGDYLVTIRMKDFSCDGQKPAYMIGLRRDGSLPETGDVEPNDSFAAARPFAATLKGSGRVGQFNDEDWFRLARVEHDTPVTLRAEGAVSVALTDGRATSSFIMAQPTEIVSGEAGEAIAGVIPAGAEAAIRVTGSGYYTLGVEMEGAEPPATDAVAGADGIELAADFPVTEAAAYWHRSQRLSGTVTIANSGGEPAYLELAAEIAQPGWAMEFPSQVAVGPGEREVVPISVEIEPDAYTASSIPATMKANGAVSTTIRFSASPEAKPVGEHASFPLQEALRGGFDLAWSALGAKLDEPMDPGQGDAPETIHDGLGANAGFIADAAQLPLDFTVRFGGERNWSVRGVALHPQVPSLWPVEYLRDFDLLLSEDGTTFELVLSGQLKALPREQVFLLPKAYPARAARLRLKSNHDGNLGRVGFSEWKVIADPKAAFGIGLDLADPTRGGHVVWSQPLISAEPPVVRGILEAGGDGTRVEVEPSQQPSFVLGFHEDRAARIASLEWTDSPPAPEAETFRSVLVETAMDSPLGPWTRLGEWRLAPGENGRSSWTLDTPVWARFLRFTAAMPFENGFVAQFPTQIRIVETATGDSYRSILGEWGEHRSEGIYEALAAEPPPAQPETDDNDSREAAGPLAMGKPVAGRVELGKDEDWYEITQPAGLDLLSIDLTGEPSVGVDVSLETGDGKTVPLANVGETPRKRRLEARVVPGETYYAHVVQPPHSVVIAYDTSGSLLSFIPIIFQALDVFAGGVTPGQEAVSFLPFDGKPMLEAFSDQPAILRQALAADPRASTTSGLEGSTITAMRALAPRHGTRAILLVTDAATSTTAAHSEMWRMVEQIRPRIFAAHIGSWDDPRREKQLLQDLALANGGHYASARSQAELDVAFERVAAWLRRPARYGLVVEARKAKPPEPGALAVVAADAGAVANTEAYVEPESSANTLEIVLDASGSMLKRMDGRRRIEIARASLTQLLTEELQPGEPVALRVFGHDRPGSCETAMLQPLSPLDPEAMATLVASIEPQNLARTPIAESLRQVREDLAGATGRKTVVLLTDGEETCGGNPRAAIAALAADDVEVRVNIVGFAVDDDALKAEFRKWARIGRGAYYDAAGPEQLDAAVKVATGLPFRAIGPAGTVAAQGTVGGDPASLPAGSYRVEIGFAPGISIENVVVREGETTRLDYAGE